MRSNRVRGRARGDGRRRGARGIAPRGVRTATSFDTPGRADRPSSGPRRASSRRACSRRASRTPWRGRGHRSGEIWHQSGAAFFSQSRGAERMSTICGWRCRLWTPRAGTPHALGSGRSTSASTEVLTIIDSSSEPRSLLRATPRLDRRRCDQGLHLGPAPARRGGRVGDRDVRPVGGCGSSGTPSTAAAPPRPPTPSRSTPATPCTSAARRTSTTNIASAPAHQSLFAGSSDGFLARFDGAGMRP